MLYFNDVKLLVYDLTRHVWKPILIIAMLAAGIVWYSSVAMFPPYTVPDLYATYFSSATLQILVLPLFLFLLSTVLPNVMDPLRIIRFKSRAGIANIIFITIIVCVCMYLVVYGIGAFLYAWFLSGSLENTWVTTEGTPYIAMEGKVDLSLFQTHYMIIRYAVTELLAFLVIGFAAALLYLWFKRYVIVFFVLEVLLFLDYALYDHFQISLFIVKAHITLGNWGDGNDFINIIAYLLGLLIVLGVAVYITLSKKNLIYESERQE